MAEIRENWETKKEDGFEGYVLLGTYIMYRVVAEKAYKKSVQKILTKAVRQTVSGPRNKTDQYIWVRPHWLETAFIVEKIQLGQYY